MQRQAVKDTATWDFAIELCHVTKYFDQVKPVGLFKREVERVMALSDVSFQIRRGEFVAYAGPNGAGKSTTFKLLSGMLAPQSGAIRVLGMDPGDDRIALMRRVGVLFGNRSELWWDHPVLSSFEWKKQVWNIADEPYQRTLQAVTDLLELKPILKTFARELSLGQRMRANLAMMLLHDPELILLDEPTLGLDVLAKRQMIDFLKQINRTQGTTILVTSHDMDDLMEMTERILLIHKGVVEFDDSYQNLMKITGDRRTLRVHAGGTPPNLEGAKLTGEERGYFLYEYDASTTPIAQLMRKLSEIDGVDDVETGRAPIEQIIAELYSHWTHPVSE